MIILILSILFLCGSELSYAVAGETPEKKSSAPQQPEQHGRIPKQSQPEKRLSLHNVASTSIPPQPLVPTNSTITPPAQQTLTPENSALKAALLSSCLEFVKKSKDFLEQQGWLYNDMPPEEFFANVVENNFYPYLYKLILTPEERLHKKIFAIADLHGDIMSLYKLFKHFEQRKVVSFDAQNNITVTDPNSLFIFTGDFVDKGRDGVETLLAVLQFKNNNVNQVILCRGNHEDIAMNHRPGEFHEELTKKFNLDPTNKEDRSFYYYIYGIYKFLPCAVFVGGKNPTNQKTEFIKFCHGGFDLGSNPYHLLHAPDSVKCMLITTLLRKTELEYIYKNNSHLPACPLSTILATYPEHVQDLCKLNSAIEVGLGEMWGDIVFADEQCPHGILRQSARGNGAVEYAKPLVDALYKEASSEDTILYATIRGHQHNVITLQHILGQKGVHCAWQKNQQTQSSEVALQQNDFVTIAPAPCFFKDYIYYNYIPYLELNLASKKMIKHQVEVYPAQPATTTTTAPTTSAQAIK